jgi:pilus assembly protein CpaB
MRRRQMNPRQRQGLLLVMIAAAGLLGVFLLVANYVSSVSKQVGPKEQIMVLLRSLPAYQQVTAADLGTIEVPQKWVPANALTAPDEAIGLISTTPLAAGTDLQQSMLTSEPLLSPNNLEIAITIDAESGVAGQITQGSLVDIIATYGSGGPNGKGISKILVPYVRVLGVPAQSSGGSGPITLSVTPEQSLQISLAESTASKLRLALVAPGSSSAPPNVPPVTQGSGS